MEKFDFYSFFSELYENKLVCIMLILYFGFGIVMIIQSKRDSKKPKKLKLNLETLKKCNGFDNEKKFISIRNKVFDMTNGL